MAGRRSSISSATIINTRLLPNAVLGDSAEHDARATGQAQEGMFFAARTLMQKMGQTLGIVVFAGLTTCGRNPGDDRGIRLSGVAGFVLCVLAGIVFVRYGERKLLAELQTAESSEHAMACSDGCRNWPPAWELEMKLRLFSLLLIIVLVAGLMPAPASAQNTNPTNTDAAVATAWSDLLLELVRSSPGFTPPVASRAMGYLGVTLWEAVAPGTPDAQSLAGRLNAMPQMPRPVDGAGYDWRLVANSAAAGALRRLFADAGGQQRTAIDGLEASLRGRYAVGLPPEVVRRSIMHGRLVGAAIFAWSRTDGGHEGYMFNFPVQYVPPSGPGLWTPTPPGYQRAMQPFWGENRPFLLTDGAECQPPPPPAYDTQPASAMYADALAVYGAVRNLTPEQREIALFWADDPTLTATPPGHSWAIATQVLRDEKATLAQAAETYARLGIAVADAFVGCWNTKFVYNRIRPLTYIQQVIDPTWNTPSVLDPVQTPPFPEYPSGHSTEAAAAAEVLRALFGADYGFIDRTQARLGFAPRFFPSFRAAAEEAAISRLYGGIHFPTGNDAGLVQGACVGQRVVDLAFYR